MKGFALRKFLPFFALAILIGIAAMSSNSSQAKSKGTATFTIEDAYGVTITKTALLNEQPVDEVCGGQTVTFRYVVSNISATLPLFRVNVQDTDPDLGDVDGTILGVGLGAGQTVTFDKTKLIQAGQISNNSATVTANYADRVYTPSDEDAFAATGSATVTGIFCDVNVVKRVDGAPPAGNQAFTFEIRSGASTQNVGTSIATAIANAGNGGNFSIGAQLQPGIQYQFCETNVLPGWTTSLSSLPGSFSPGSANPPFDNGIVCINFNPNNGTSFEVNNHRPFDFGPARTIGYWKNWSSCSGGKQSPILDYLLSTFGVSGPASPPSPLPSPLPAITNGANLGGAQVKTCQNAVKILDKTTFAGVKKASDPAYNMSAQLLAVKLNIQSGADPKCIGPYVTEADNILTTIGFNGSTVPAVTFGQAARMNTLAGYFDRYNNGDPNLCPLP